MKNTNLTSKLSFVQQFVFAVFLFSVPLAGVYAACCAGHGGVAQCNKKTGHQMCKDGTASPTCICTAAKNTKQKTTNPKNTMKTMPASTTSTAAPTSTVKAKAGTTKPKTTSPKAAKMTPASTNGTSAKGCCSRHGGVAQCNSSTGYQMCKDGTQSPTCACH